MKPMDWQKTLRYDRIHLIGETPTCIFVIDNIVSGTLDTTAPYDMVVPVRLLSPNREVELDKLIIDTAKRSGKVLIAGAEETSAINLQSLKHKMRYEAAKCRPESHVYTLTSEEQFKIDRLFYEIATTNPHKAAYLMNKTNFHAFIHDNMHSLDVYDSRVQLEQAVHIGFEGSLNYYVMFPASILKERNVEGPERNILKDMVLEEINHAADLQPNYEGEKLLVSCAISERLLAEDMAQLHQWLEIAEHFDHPLSAEYKELKRKFIPLLEKVFASDKFEEYRRDSIKEFGSANRLYQDLLWQMLGEWNAALHIFNGEEYSEISSSRNSPDIREAIRAAMEFKCEIHAKTAKVFGIFSNGDNNQYVTELFEFMFPPLVAQTNMGIVTNSTESNRQMNKIVSDHYNRYSESERIQGDKYLDSIKQNLAGRSANLLQTSSKPPQVTR